MLKIVLPETINIMKKLLFSIFTLLSIYSFAQTTAVKGRILDENNFPLPGAVISQGEDSYVVSDFDGFFTLLTEGAENVNATVTYTGFETQDIVLDPASSSIQLFVLQPAINTLDEVVVSGFQGGVVKSLNKQKNDINITNVVSADQVGKFPDANIGDALKRISGITMQYDQGEARDIIIRGFSPGLNSVTLNGERIPSAEGDNRRVQMDLIPSDMIQLIEVSKTLTPDMEADAIGGSVNLVTRSNPNGFRLSTSISAGANPVREGGFNRNMTFILADKLSDRLGYTLSASHNTSDYGSDNIEFEWDDSETPELKEQDIRRYDVKRTRRSIALNLDYELDVNNKVYFKSIYNSRDDWENRFRVRFDDFEDGEVRIRKQTKGGIGNDRNDNRRLEDQRTYKLAFGGEHQLGKLSMDWKYSFSKASEKRPDERYIRFDQKGVAANMDTSNAEFPGFIVSASDLNNTSEFKFKEAQDAQKDTEEDNNSFRVNFKLPYSKNDYIKFGYKLNQKSKLRDDIWYEYEIDGVDFMSNTSTKDYTVPGYLPGSKYTHGQFASAEYLGGLNFSGGELLFEEFATGNYAADEAVNAAYLMFVDKLGENTTVIAGARLESTTLDYVGYAYDEEEGANSLADLEELKGSNDYSNILPNFTIQTKLGENFILNGAYTVGIARPAYFELVPYQAINSADLEIAVGNPDLEATVSNNFDLMAEYYFSNVGLITGGVFVKNIDNWLYLFSDDDYQFRGESYDYEQVRNGRTAAVNGIELGLQTRLSFLPGFLGNTTFYGNYTYTNTSTDGVADRGDDVPLVGAAENMFNASLAYESNKFFLRASMNYAGESLDEIGGNIYEDRYYDEQLFIDLNATYAINNRVRIFAEAKNLTNQPLRYYQGLSERTMQLEYYDINWNFGIKVDLR